MEIKNSVVVITGASSGIGRETALELAQKGAYLVLVARREHALHKLAEECERLGGKALPVPTDVSIEDHVYAVAHKAVQRFGKIDVWINNAAVTVAGPFDEIPMQDFRRVLEINLFGYIYGARAAVPYFKRQGSGTLINIASMVAITGEPFFAPYAISKSAIRGLSISLNQELKENNIHVCSVLPAVIDTPIFNQSANYMGKPVIAPGKAIPAEDVAHAIIGLIKKPRREVFVGSKGRFSSAFSFLSPESFDTMNHDKILKEHFEGAKKVSHSRGNLYDPMKEYASVSGGWIKKVKNEHLKFLVPAASAATGAALGLAYYFSNKNKGKKAD